MRQERKVVTVLFCDLVGFTSRAEEMDPEDVAALLGPYHARLKAELERHGGTVEKFIGDAAMALFGAPTAHEDDPERAVRAGLAICAFAEKEGIELRIGITTGDALVNLEARPEAGETVATGDVVNTAARLQAAAPVNGILVSEKTYEATKQAIEYAEAEAVEAKGKARPVRVWEAVAARSRIGLDRPHGTQLVGRSRELTLLEGALDRARQERSPQLATLVGVPGIGKSRIVYELSQAVERSGELIFWRVGRCLPYGDGVTFWALTEIVKAHAGILETDSPARGAQKLHAIANDPWVESHLGLLVGLGAEQEFGGDRRAEAFAAWSRFFETLAEERSLVLVFEDLHWADENLLDFVDYLVDWASGVALLCVCTARPELLERRPGWGGGKPNSLTLSLSPLSDEETASLFHELLERPLPSPDTQIALLARAGGNPLYAEQYARMLEEREPTGEPPLPETVQGIIAARLDGLAPAEKALLQDAAVMGRVFWTGALASLARDDHQSLEQSLHALERKEFIRRERQSTVADEMEFAFRHLLVRDVAYGQIPRAERAEKHRRAAAWIESLGRAEDHAEMLAHHYQEALSLAEAAGLDMGSLAERARTALRDAGDRAVALYAYSAADSFYAAALELWPSEDPERPYVLFRRAKAASYAVVEQGGLELLEEARGELLLAGDDEAAAEADTVISRQLWYLGRRDAAYEHADRAVALVAGGHASRAKAHALAERARLHAVAGELTEANLLSRDVLAIAEELGLDGLLADALTTLGMSRFESGDQGGMEDLERALAIAIAGPAPVEAARTYGNIANAHWELGELEKAAETLAAMRSSCERFGLSGQLRWVTGAEAIDRYKAGRWPEAERIADDFVHGAESGSPHYQEPNCRFIRAYVRVSRGDLEGVDTDTARAVELARETKDSQNIVPALAARVRVLLALERADEADTLVEELVGPFAGVPSHWLVDVAWACLDLGRAERFLPQCEIIKLRSPWVEAAGAIARGDFGRAADRLGAIGARGEEAYARLRAASRLASDGHPAAASAELHRALPFFQAVGATRYVDEVEALLASIA